MTGPEIPGYGLCYLEPRPSVGQRSFYGEPMPESEVPVQEAARESAWLVRGRSAAALIVTAVLLALGVANIGLRARWHEVEDGVLWGARAEGLTALEFANGSPGNAGGIQRGDVLVAINGAPVQTVADVVDWQH